MLAIIERLAGGRIKVDLDIDPQPMFIQLDAPAVEQIVLNLVTNARDAMQGAGQLTILARSHAPVVDGAPSHRLRAAMGAADHRLRPRGSEPESR